MPFLWNNIECFYSFQWLVILTSKTSNSIYSLIFSNTGRKFIPSLMHRLSSHPLTCKRIQYFYTTKYIFSIIAPNNIDKMFIRNNTKPTSLLPQRTPIFPPSINPYLRIRNPFLTFFTPNNIYTFIDNNTSKLRSRCLQSTNFLPMKIR